MLGGINIIRTESIGHSYGYAVESLIKMFFPTARFSEKTFSEDFLITKVKKTAKKIRILAIGNIDGKHLANRDVISIASSDDDVKEALCRCCYLLLQKLTGISPPWGTLTGVRPVKRVMQALEQGKTTEDISKELTERFFVSKDKISLALQTAITQREILLPFNPKRYSLYISIPFCPTRCRYCSFVSQAIGGKTDLIAPYLKLLHKELEDTANLAQKLGMQIDCVYVGGGTPTVLSAVQIKELLCTVKKLFPTDNLREFTVEAGRPDTITEEKLRVIKACGVKRICINPQSFSDTVLAAIGRKHTSKQTIDSYICARNIGFDAINMDFIAGLPGDTVEDFSNSIKKALELGAENITVHSLSVKRSSDFHRDGVCASDAVEATKNAYRLLTNANYRPYYLYRQKSMIGGLENVGYALPKTESPYNVAIMEENQTILACGAGSSTKMVGKDKIIRFFDYKYPTEYIERFDELRARREHLEDIAKELNI